MNQARRDCIAGTNAARTACEREVKKLQRDTVDESKNNVNDIFDGVFGRRRRRQVTDGQKLNIYTRKMLLRLLRGQDGKTERAYRLVEGEIFLN